MSSAASKKIIVNADDFAFSYGTDTAIVRLAAMGAISATTALVYSPRFSEERQTLVDLPIAVGMHLDFTSHFVPKRFAGCRSVKELIVKAWTRTLDAEAVMNSIRFQFDEFESVLGRAPEIVDGHEHCHQFPVIRELLLKEMARRYRGVNQKPLLRSTAPRSWRGVKAAVIAALGSSALSRKAVTVGLPVSGDFAGVYDYEHRASATDIESLWDEWLSGLAASAQPSMVMCHPGIAGEYGATDVMADARDREYSFLASEAFKQLLAKHETQLVHAW